MPRQGENSGFPRQPSYVILGDERFLAEFVLRLGSLARGWKVRSRRLNRLVLILTRPVASAGESLGGAGISRGYVG
jgi:hypothetical protein